MTRWSGLATFLEATHLFVDVHSCCWRAVKIAFHTADTCVTMAVDNWPQKFVNQTVDTHWYVWQMLRRSMQSTPVHYFVLVSATQHTQVDKPAAAIAAWRFYLMQRCHTALNDRCAPNSPKIPVFTCYVVDKCTNVMRILNLTFDDFDGLNLNWFWILIYRWMEFWELFTVLQSVVKWCRRKHWNLR